MSGPSPDLTGGPASAPMSGPSPDLTDASHEGSAPVRGGVRVWSPMRRSPQASTRGVLQASTRGVLQVSTRRPPRTSTPRPPRTLMHRLQRGHNQSPCSSKSHLAPRRSCDPGARTAAPSASSWTPSGPPWGPRSPATPKPCRSSTWRTRCRTTARSPRTTPPSRNRTAGSPHTPACRTGQITPSIPWKQTGGSPNR